MRPASIAFVALSAVILAAGGCGGAAQGTAAPGAPIPGSATVDAVPTPTAWSSDLPLPQQSAYMKKYVVGPMGKVFRAHDETKYADFGCKYCHGDFTDPHDHLPHLTLKGDTLTAFEEHPDIARFMAGEVLPAMAAAMHQRPMDPRTHEGFGCGGCHAIDKK
jgi:hypothetical protein